MTWWILAGLGYGIAFIFMLSLCKAAKMEDEDWERIYRERCRGDRAR